MHIEIKGIHHLKELPRSGKYDIIDGLRHRYVAFTNFEIAYSTEPFDVVMTLRYALSLSSVWFFHFR